MLSVRSVYKIGLGPSSSHTMGPALACRLFLQRFDHPPASLVVTLYDGLALTGRGHLTDKAILQSTHPICTEILWRPDKHLSLHPNGMDLEARDRSGELLDRWRVYSIGGGQLRDESGPIQHTDDPLYPATSFQDVLDFSDQTGKPLWAYLDAHDSPDAWTHLKNVWQTMRQAVERGIASDQQTLPGELKLKRRARSMHSKALEHDEDDRKLISSYALAVSEENASGGRIVTAPTCGSSGILPGVLYHFQKNRNASQQSIGRALAIAGMIGAVIEHRASISGAEVGCQGEVGAACCMASAAAAFLLGAANGQIEYAAEMGLEHFLGLTCDPVLGLVQVPCIERNAFAAMRAMDCATYAIATDGQHIVKLDEVIDVMNDTGHDLQAKYRETAAGGLASIVRLRLTTQAKPSRLNNAASQ